MSKGRGREGEKGEYLSKGLNRKANGFRDRNLLGLLETPTAEVI